LLLSLLSLLLGLLGLQTSLVRLLLSLGGLRLGVPLLSERVIPGPLRLGPIMSGPGRLLLSLLSGSLLGLSLGLGLGVFLLLHLLDGNQASVLGGLRRLASRHGDHLPLSVGFLIAWASARSCCAF